jgi:hypothetical protein
MDWTATIETVKQLGFPIVVTLYILIRLEKSMKEVIDKVVLLSENIVALNTYMRTKFENMGGNK